MALEDLTIKEQVDTPYVHLNATAGTLEITGRSLPENAVVFYEPVMHWLDSYLQHPAEETVLSLKLEYFNSSSSLMLLKLMNRLQTLRTAGKAAKVLWFYVRGDDLMEERGLEMQELLEIPIEVRTY